jgi:hypothetical protein
MKVKNRQEAQDIQYDQNSMKAHKNNKNTESKSNLLISPKQGSA